MLLLVLIQNKQFVDRSSEKANINKSFLTASAGFTLGFSLNLNQKHIDICPHKGIIFNNNNKNNIIWDLKTVEGKIAQMILNAFQAHLNQIR